MNENIVEIKYALSQLISSQQFVGMNHEYPHSHLYTFYELCGAFGMIGNRRGIVTEIASISLTEKAKAWLQSQPNQSLTIWNDVETRFLWKDVETRFLSPFFPPSKNIGRR